ncbi:hypothetical protein D3C86_1409030 [compost metagenome]
MPQPLLWANAATPSTLGYAASRSGVKCAAMCLITVAEQFTEDRMPMKLRVPTRPSGRT